jgi:8-oxo-dGTP pyrophosphatase MutT (NUDIX family)
MIGFNPEKMILVQRALIFNYEGKFLFIQRPGTANNNPWLWEIPGGKVDPGEDPLHSLARETFEETGLDVIPDKNIVHVHAYDILDPGKHYGKRYRCETRMAAIIGPIVLNQSEEHIDTTWETSNNSLLRLNLTTTTKGSLLALGGAGV